MIPCPGPARILANLEELLELLGGQAVPPQNPVDPLWVNRSWTRQLVATWSGRSALGTTIPPRFGNVHRFRDLVLRSVTTLSPRNPAAVDNEAGPATQRYDVVLVDRHGEQDRVPAERFSTTLEPALGDAMRQLILSDVRIPLRRFDGVDTHHLRGGEASLRRPGTSQGPGADLRPRLPGPRRWPRSGAGGHPRAPSVDGRGPPSTRSRSTP